jgi:regulator of protease activity HflC (stomatin/prohibitin superfamily)
MAKISVPINANLIKKSSIVGVVAVLILIMAATSSFTVNFGTVAVLTRFGEIVDEPKGPGLHFKIPFVDKVLTYRTQKVIYETLSTTPTSNSSNADYQDYAVDTNTLDGQQVSIRYTVRFSIDPEQIKDVANTLGTEAEVVEKIVKTDSRIWVRQIPRNYTATELYTSNLDKVSQEIYGKLDPIFKENGLILDEFGIRAIEFNQDYVEAIEQKQIEAEKVKTEEFIAEQEEFKKKAQITRAQGEAESQRLQQNSLNEKLLQKLYIEKWDGKLPDVVTGDSGPLLNLDLAK